MRLGLALVAGLGTLRAAPECLQPTGEYVPTRVPYTCVLDRREPYAAGSLERHGAGIPWLIETGALTPGRPY